MGEKNILELAGDAEDLLNVVLCMKTTEKEKTKHRQHANSQQRDDRVKAHRAKASRGVASLEAGEDMQVGDFLTETNGEADEGGRALSCFKADEETLSNIRVYPS